MCKNMMMEPVGKLSVLNFCSICIICLCFLWVWVSFSNLRTKCVTKTDVVKTNKRSLISFGEQSSQLA